MKVYDLALEHRTNRLTRIVTAMTLASDMTPATAKSFRDLARAVRLSAEGNSNEHVASLADRIREAVLGQPDLSDWHRIITIVCNEVASAARKEWKHS